MIDIYYTSDEFMGETLEIKKGCSEIHIEDSEIDELIDQLNCLKRTNTRNK